MSEIIRNRTIRPASRLETSRSYKIDTKQVSRGDILIVNIDHESKSFHRTYKFNGLDIANKDSICFIVKDFGSSIEIRWSGAQPIGANIKISKQTLSKLIPKIKLENRVIKSSLTDSKTSFDPISNSDTSILILGTMPGDKSIELNEYYGHSRNRFWKIISSITNNPLPLNYTDKKTLLLKTAIGIWDIAHKANRKGSLDSAIKNEEPNDLNGLISKHKNLKTIGFNGAKAKVLFDKYFTRQDGINYIVLPSSSPANAGIDFQNICKQWKQILK